MPDVSRSDSQRSDSSQRPRVSFNRDVRIKRIGNVDGEGQGQGEGQGEGHRRQRGHGSRSQSAREAAIVNIPVMDTSHRKSTIPKRNTKDIVNQNRINDTSRKKLTRSVSDAGSRYTHDRNKYGPGKSYWSENEGEEDSASSEGGRQKLRKQEEKKINIFATLNNRLRGKKKKNNVDSNRSRAEDLRPTTPTRRTDTGIEVVPNFKTEKSKSKSIENLLPEIGAHQQKKSGQLTQTSTLPRRSKNSKKQLSPIIEDEPIASNSRRSPFDFNDQDRRMNSVQDDLNLNSAPKIIIEPPTPIQEVEEKIFTTSKRRSDQALKRDNEINLNLLNFSGRDSRSSMRGEEHDGHKSVEKNDRGRLSSIRDYRKNELEKIEDKKPFVGRVYDLSTRTIRNDNKTRIKPKAETKSRSKFYDNEEWFSSEEDFSLAHDNGHYKSYDYGLLDPDLSLTISDEVDGRKKKVEEGKQIEVVDDSKKNASKIESLPPKTYSKEGKDLGTILMKEGLGKNKKSTNDEDGEEERLTNERRDRVKRTSSVNMNADGRSTMGDDERRDSLDNSRPKIKQEGYFKSGSNSQKEPGKNIEGRNSLSRRFFEKERRGSLQGLGDKFDIHNETETSTRKLVTSDEEEKMSRKTVGMLVQELSRKQNAKKRKENFQADKTKSGGPLIDPLLDVDRQHNNNKPFSYTDPYKSPPPLQPTDAEVIYAQVICCRPAVGGHEAAGLAANTEFRVSLEPSVELATSDRIQQPSSQKNSGSRRAASNAAVKVYEKAELDDSDHTTTNNSNLPGKQSNNGFIIATNVSQNYRKTKKGSPVDLNRTIDNNSNNYNNFSSNISNNESRKTLERKLVDYNNPSISEINSTVEYANESQQIKSERVRKKDRLNKDSSEVFSETLGNDSTVNSEKKVITRKEFLVDDYSFSPIVEETREASSFGENKRYHQSSPSLYFSKSERDLSNLDNFSQEIQKEEGGGKRESIIRIDVEKDNIAYHQDYFDSKSQKMNTTHSASTEKLLSGDIHDLSLRRHRLESIIDSHKRRFENRAISPNRYSRTLTRSVSNVSPSHRNSNRLIEDDLSSATKKTIKEDRYFERHIKRTASNFKDKDLLSDSAPLKIESDDSYRTNRNGRNNYKTYNYYLKNDSKNNEKFNNEYNLTNSIRDNKYRSSDNVADIYQHNEESNNEINGTKYGKKHFREWYTSTSVKKTERGSGDDSYGYGYDGSLKGEEGGERFTDEGRNIRADGKYPTRTLPTPSSDDGKDNRKGKGSGRGGFFEKLSTPRKVSGLEKVRRKLSNWNSAKKNSSQDKVEKKDKKKKKGKEEKVHEEEPKDPLTSRYSEYRGEESAAEEDHTARESDYYATRQRVSTPETDPTWFRSLDRIKHKSSHSRLSGEDTVDRKHRPVSRANSTSQKNLRFFGESDSGSYPSLNTSHLQVPSNRTSSRLRSSLDSSAESTLEDDSGHSQKSVVYLHAATGSRKLHRSQITSGRRSMSREELSSNKTDSTFVPHKRTLSRSISVLAPWRPRHPRDGIDVNYNDAGKPPRAPIKISNRTLTKLQQQENKRRPVSSAGADRRGSDQSTSTAAASGVSISSRRRDETDLARSKSVPRSSKLSSGWFRAK